MIVIKAQVNNITEIDILGDIGESFWGYGITLESFKSQIDKIKGDIIINVSSLGGNAFDGLAISDLIKSYKHGEVTTKIIGATASAGTFIGISGKNVQMSKNALFLIHNSHVVAQGNAVELRKTAEQLDTVDRLQIELYKSKTGKEETFITDLMGEEKWITASEAKEYGFVDEIFEPMAIAAKYDNKIIKAAGLPELPNEYLKNMEDKTLKENILALVGFKNDEAIKAENVQLKSDLEAVKAKLTDSELSATIQAKLETANKELETIKASISTKDLEIADIKTKLETEKEALVQAKAEIAALKASGTNLAGDDPNPDGGETQTDRENPFKPKSEAYSNLIDNLIK